MAFTFKQYQGLLKRDTRKISPHAKPTNQPAVLIESGWVKASVEAHKKRNPRGQHKPGQMNKSEQAYASHLMIMEKAGEVRSWKFEAIKLKLADNTYFIPDFDVEMKNGDLVLVDVKRLWKGKTRPHFEDDAICKLKVAAEIFPWFTICACWWNGSQWEEEIFPCSRRN